MAGWTILGVLAAAALTVGLVRVPELIAALGLVILFGVAVVRHPSNGVTALVLASPFLLGEHKTPYFLLVHLGAAAVVLVALGRRLTGGTPFVPAYARVAALWVGVAFVALPLNLRDLLEDLWVLGLRDWAGLALHGIPDIAHPKYLELTLTLGLAAALFLVAAQPSTLPGVIGAVAPLAAVVAVVSAFGLLRFFGAVTTTGQYLTLSFWTWQHPDLRLTGVAWNPDYLAQCLVLAVPLLVTVAWTRASPWERGLGAGAAALGALALVFTFQRGAWVSLLVALVSLALLQARGHGPGPARDAGGGRALVALGAGVLAAGVALDVLVLDGRVLARLGRLAEDPNRIQLWATALGMARDHPLLGVGTGRYAFFFHEYVDPEVRGRFGPFWGTAHSTYLHLLAEQGVAGLASFWLFFGSVWLGAFRRLPGVDAERQGWTRGVLAALAGWFAYGAVQHTFRVTALVYLVAILAGTLAALAPPSPRSRARRRPALAALAVLAALAIGLLVLAVRAEAALRRPVSPGYEAGFYRWERQADGRAARWMRARAAMTTPVRGRILTVPLGAPIPGVERRPQVVRLWVDRRPQPPVRLDRPGWETVAVPVAARPGGHVLVELEVAYTVVPSRLGPSRDDRELGVMMGEVGWRDG